MASTINEIARGVTEQAENTTEGSERLIELGNIIEEDKEHIDEVNKSTLIVSEYVKEGLKISDHLSLKTKENNEVSTATETNLLAFSRLARLCKK